MDSPHKAPVMPSFDVFLVENYHKDTVEQTAKLPMIWGAIEASLYYYDIHTIGIIIVSYKLLACILKNT